jgi:hypothetical protein
MNRANREGEYVKMKAIKNIFVVILLASLCAPLTAFALSYPPAPLYHRLEKVETVMTPGAAVYLFHSGTDEINSAIYIDEVLTVYRIDPSCEVRVTGKIRVKSHIGETYLKGEVIEGEIKPNDIAKKGKISLLIISAGACGR